MKTTKRKWTLFVDITAPKGCSEAEATLMLRAVLEDACSSLPLKVRSPTQHLNSLELGAYLNGYKAGRNLP